MVRLLKPYTYLLPGIAVAAALLAGMLWGASGGSAAGNLIPTVIPTVDTAGQYTSLVLDASGNPVVSYYDPVGDDMRVLHCGNPNCSAGNSVSEAAKASNTTMIMAMAMDMKMALPVRIKPARDSSTTTPA